MTLVIIIVWVITLLSFYAGYLIGSKTKPEILEKLEELRKPKVELGPMKRPTAQDLADRDNPVVEAGKKEMGKLIREQILRFTPQQK